MSAGNACRASRLERLAELAGRLAPDELELLVFVAERLEMGRLRYGALDVARDGRDFRAEALEELADAVVYLGAALLRGRAHSRPRRRDPLRLER